MDFERYRDYPVVGSTVFAEPTRGLFGWILLGATVLFTGLLLLDRGPKVALLAGGGLILLAVPNVLPERYYEVAVITRVVAILYYVTLWIVILTVFPDAPTFFQGNW